MPTSDDQAGNDDDEQSECASPPCFQREVDPDYAEYSHDGAAASDKHHGQAADIADWAGISAWRKAERSRLALQRDKLDAESRERINAAIVENLRQGFSFSSTVVGFYWPLAGEIDLRPLMTELAGEGVPLVLPAIVGKQRPLEFRRWAPGDELDSSGLWSIPAPKARNLLSPTLLCVPLLGFDGQCHRLGYGGGFFDRTLAEPGFEPITVGIACESGRLTTIYPQKHDIPMQFIVTERGITRRVDE
jgi:5,10-methenyltetrahydrofolate synthetase